MLIKRELTELNPSEQSSSSGEYEQRATLDGALLEFDLDVFVGEKESQSVKHFESVGFGE